VLRRLLLALRSVLCWWWCCRGLVLVVVALLRVAADSASVTAGSNSECRGQNHAHCGRNDLGTS
jgi:hypothetical protein